MDRAQPRVDIKIVLTNSKCWFTTEYQIRPPRAEPKAAPMQMALTTRPSNAGVKIWLVRFSHIWKCST